jgi:putative FmdB family regulatory protein
VPIYEYRCENGHKWAEQRMVDARREPAKCPECEQDGKLAPSTGVYGTCPSGTPKFYGR